MAEKTYVIKVKVEKGTDFKEIEQALWDADATDVDLLEVYDD